MLSSASQRRGFTLIELLVVIAVIGILVAVLLPMLAGARDRANIAAARSFIQNIQQATTEYESDYGRYVPGDSTTAFDTNAANLVTYLDGNTANGGPKKQYLEFKADLVTGGKPIDPWARSYGYLENRRRLQKAGVTSEPTKKYKSGAPDPKGTLGWNWQTYDMWSEGPDPADQSGWLGNWQ